MNKIPHSADEASAYLFANGNAIYFDDKGEQMVELQQKGLSGLHCFVAEYPNASIYWAVWEKSAGRVPSKVLPWLLRHIRHTPASMSSDDSLMT